MARGEGLRGQNEPTSDFWRHAATSCFIQSGIFFFLDLTNNQAKVGQKVPWDYLKPFGRGGPKTAKNGLKIDQPVISSKKSIKKSQFEILIN